MVVLEYCEVHEVSNCADCHRPRVPVQDSALWGPWVDARFPGSCAECGDHIVVGQQIRSNGRRSWLCTNCGHG